MTIKSTRPAAPGSAPGREGRCLGEYLAQAVQNDLACASDALAWSGVRRHSGVHEARKAMRRVRSLLALGRETFAEAWRPLDRSVRRSNRALCRLRDAHALVDAASRMRKLCDPAEQDAWQAVIKRLRELRNRLLTSSLREDPQLQRQRLKLAGLADQARALPWSSLRDEQVEQALGFSLRRVAEAERKARRTPSAEHRHRLRRRLRRLRMQWNSLRAAASSPECPGLAARMRALLRRLRPELPKRRELGRRSDTLGWEQNLRVLDAALTRLDLAEARTCRQQVRAALRALERHPV